MKEIDEFLQFLFDHKSDDRIEISKKMKYGYRYYYISFNVDEKPEDDNNQSSRSLRGFRISESVEITIDNRNCCIELIYDQHSSNIIIEDKSLVEKWSTIFEEYINQDAPQKITKVLEDTLSSCFNKDLYRIYQMKKILPDNESL